VLVPCLAVSQVPAIPSATSPHTRQSSAHVRLFPSQVSGACDSPVPRSFAIRDLAAAQHSSAVQKRANIPPEARENGKE
jgi:hypothetical protein